MRFFTAAIIVVSTFLSKGLYAQEATSVEWGRPVVYDDFKCPPPKSDTAAANISVTILLGYAKAKDGYLRFKVVAVMDQDESWIKPQYRNKEILTHEQGHFDIAHIYARKLEADLRKKRYTMKDVSALHSLYDNYLEQMDVLQVRYDRETRGGLDTSAQTRWREYILRQIVTVQD